MCEFVQTDLGFNMYRLIAVLRYMICVLRALANLVLQHLETKPFADHLAMHIAQTHDIGQAQQISDRVSCSMQARDIETGLMPVCGVQR